MVVERAAIQGPVQEAYDEPVVIKGAILSWPAMQSWSPKALVDRFGSNEYACQIDLPTGVPSEHLSKDYTRRMKLAEFANLMMSASPNAPCYMHQRSITQFPGLEDDLRFEELMGTGARQRSVNLWIGSAGTKTSLHFDYQDGLLAQLYGTKNLLLAGPRDSRNLYVMGGYIQKSRVDAEDPDLRRFPRYAHARILSATIGPGDAIFIPRSWWHMVRSLEPSISVNQFFGEKLGARELLRKVAEAGPATWVAVARDFVWHGVLRAKLEGRLYSEAPFGVWFYNQARGYIERRLAG